MCNTVHSCRDHGQCTSVMGKKEISLTYMHEYGKEKTLWITNHKLRPHREVWGPYESWQDYQERSVLLLFSSTFPVHTADTETKGQKWWVENKTERVRQRGVPCREKNLHDWKQSNGFKIADDVEATVLKRNCFLCPPWNIFWLNFCLISKFFS